MRLTCKTLESSIHDQLVNKSHLILENSNDVEGLEIFNRLQMKHLQIHSIFFNMSLLNLENPKCIDCLNSIEILQILQYPNHSTQFRLSDMPKLKVLKVRSQPNRYTIMESSFNTIDSINLTNLDKLEVRITYKLIFITLMSFFSIFKVLHFDMHWFMSIKEILFSHHTYNHLKELRLICNFHDSIVNLIATNLFNLRKLTLIRNSTPFRCSDLNLILKYLSNLEELTLECVEGTVIGEYENDNMDTNVTIMNLQKLKSIKCSGISNFSEIHIKYLEKHSVLESLIYRNCFKEVSFEDYVVNFLMDRLHFKCFFKRETN